MKYLLMVCAGEERVASPPRMSIEEWVERADRSGVRLLGRELTSPGSAATVSVRGGETLLSDGPFSETKEFVAGFDIVDCPDLDAAIELAADHPVAAFGAIEVRPFLEDFVLPDAARAWAREEPAHSWVHLVSTDGVAVEDAVRAEEIRGACRDWDDRLREQGTLVFAQPLADAGTATSVRLIDGEALLSDGPFVETKEFIGGLVILQGIDRAQAIRLAAEHPLAGLRRIEVRAFGDS